MSTSKNKRGDDSIVYKKEYPDRTVVYVEEVRTGRKELAAVTMWKTKKSALTDANSTKATQISDLSGLSDGKVTNSAEDKQGKEQESSTQQSVEAAVAEVDTKPADGATERMSGPEVVKPRDGKDKNDGELLFRTSDGDLPIRNAESDKQAKRMQEIKQGLESKGATGLYVSRSVTSWGVSTYLQSHDLPGFKLRISDHSVENFYRIYNEIHVYDGETVSDVVDKAMDRWNALTKRKAADEARWDAFVKRTQRADEMWDEIKGDFDGLQFFTMQRTYMDMDEFMRKHPTAQHVMQTEEPSNQYDKDGNLMKAYRYEWADKPNQYGEKKPSMAYIESIYGERGELRFREGQTEKELTEEEVSRRFDEQLESQAKDGFEDGDVYRLGKPSAKLVASGFPAEQPIEMSASHLAVKSKDKYHPFDIRSLKGLVSALRNPLAVFPYGDPKKALNAIVELKYGDDNFIIGVHFGQEKDGKITASIRGVFPKYNTEWMKWIENGKAIGLDKARLMPMVEEMRDILSDKEKTEKYMSNRLTRGDLTDVNLDFVAKIINDFGKNNGEVVFDEIDNDATIRFRESGEGERSNVEAAKRERVQSMSERLNTPIRVVENVEEITHADPKKQAKMRRSKGWYDTETGEVVVNLARNRDAEDVAIMGGQKEIPQPCQPEGGSRPPRPLGEGFRVQR